MVIAVDTARVTLLRMEASMDKNTVSIPVSENTRYGGTEVLEQTGQRYFGIWEVPFSIRDIGGVEEAVEHVVDAGEVGCLDLIAWNYLNDERLWWIIAWFNNIINPIEEVKAGTVILIPNPTKVLKWLQTT